MQPWETLKLEGIIIRTEDKHLVVEMTLDGASKLARSLIRMSVRQPYDVDLFKLFLDELTNEGKRARNRARK